MRLAHISWKQAQEYFKSKDTILLATGSLEGHGAHVALGTDAIIPEYLLKEIEKKTDVLIAPTMPYGACDSLVEFSGTVSLSEQGFYTVIKNIVDSLKQHGGKKFIFLNGHGGNISVLKKICLELDAQDCIGTIINWWLLAGEINPSWKGGHGGAQETAAMMAINPEFVHLENTIDLCFQSVSSQLPQIGFYEVSFRGQAFMVPRKIRRIAKDSWIGPDDPREATVEWGKAMLKETTEMIVDYINTFSDIDLQSAYRRDYE